jgi:hypothetical protein
MCCVRKAQAAEQSLVSELSLPRHDPCSLPSMRLSRLVQQNTLNNSTVLLSILSGAEAPYTYKCTSPSHSMKRIADKQLQT